MHSLLKLAMLFLYSEKAYAMVAGVDFGGEYFKIALVKPGTPFEIVTNIHSKRKTDNLVAFDGEDRLYGADALNVGVRRPKSAYSQMRRLVGVPPEHPLVQEMTNSEYLPYEILKNNTRGSCCVKHGEKNIFETEELIAMLFSHGREITNAFANSKVKDWVITVPSYYTQSQRQAILDAAEITGVRVLSLIEENTAAALQYGIDRVYDEKPYRVLYYNMGSSALQVSIVEYSSYVVPDGFKKNKTVGTFDVLAKTWDAALGGSAFDLRLTEFLADEANKKLKVDEIRKIPRPMAKLKAQAKKTKVVLSANEQIPVVMQSLYNDIDFHSHVTRKQFEAMCHDLFDRILIPVKSALAKAELSVQDIDEVEIVGGAVRMPKVQQILKKFFDRTVLGVHVNGDEGMALGAAFRGANISNAFRVRTVGMSDINSFPIGVRFADLLPSTDDDAWVKRATLFNLGAKYGLKKSVTFHHNKDFTTALRYDKPSELPAGASSKIARYNITGLTQFAESLAEKDLGLPKVVCSFLLDTSGMVNIVKVEAILEETLPSDPEEEKKAESEKDDESKEITKEENEKSTDKDTKATEPKPVKKKIHRKTLTVTSADTEYDQDGPVLPMSALQKSQSIAMLKEMQHLDDVRMENAAAKNELEAYVYSSRDRLRSNRDRILEIKVETEENLDALASEINDAEDWLYDEGENVSSFEYRQKLRSISTKLDAIMFRLSEHENLPAAINRVASYSDFTRSLMSTWETEKEYIKESERMDVLQRLDELQKWTDEKAVEQNKLKPHEVPSLTSQEILIKLKSIKRTVTILSKRPKPLPPKVPANETSDTATESNTTESSSTEDKKTDDDETTADLSDNAPVDDHSEL